jgi:hypothetical protein
VSVRVHTEHLAVLRIERSGQPADHREHATRDLVLPEAKDRRDLLEPDTVLSQWWF